MFDAFRSEEEKFKRSMDAVIENGDVAALPRLHRQALTILKDHGKPAALMRIARVLEYTGQVADAAIAYSQALESSRLADRGEVLDRLFICSGKLALEPRIQIKMEILRHPVANPRQKRTAAASLERELSDANRETFSHGKLRSAAVFALWEYKKPKLPPVHKRCVQRAVDYD